MILERKMVSQTTNILQFAKKNEITLQKNGFLDHNHFAVCKKNKMVLQIWFLRPQTFCFYKKKERNKKKWFLRQQIFYICTQGGITCEAIDEPRKSSKAIDKRVIINFRDKNVVIACITTKMRFLFYLFLYMSRLPLIRNN